MMTISPKSAPWICCQLGAREHYAIPRALQQHGHLACLITDAWVNSNATLRLSIPPLNHLRERFHADLASASVRAFTRSLIRFELGQRLQTISGWEQIINRNLWFQTQALLALEALSPERSTLFTLDCRPTLFAYSYAALELLCYAKRKGWRTILGQIDPGPLEEERVLKEHARCSIYRSSWRPAPSHYWECWQEECATADWIVVNSDWSSQALQHVGIPGKKIKIIPLAYTPPSQANDFMRVYPPFFSVQRPLRVLFLGQVILRKGIACLLEAAEILQDRAVEFWIVGSQGISKVQPAVGQFQIKWIGSVPRSATARYYQQADVFLFPTLSDGFGLTQLEAQAWKLPIIASRFCGSVVKDRVNGLVLEEVSGDAIASTLKFCLNHPQQLQFFSQRATHPSQFNLSNLENNLHNLPHVTV